jgi:deoxyribonuclease-4
VGAGIGAAGVVLHPGSAKQGDVGQAIKRAGQVIGEALSESERCPLDLEDTAGAGGTLGRSFEELSELIDAAGGGRRLGVCLDSCHLLASGYDIRTAAGLSHTLDRFDATVGLARLGSLHLNDSKTPLGSNRDRHANVGQGELGERGCAAFLSEPRFEQLPLVLETQGAERQGPDREEIELCFKLRRRGQASRARGRTRSTRSGGNSSDASNSSSVQRR